MTTWQQDVQKACAAGFAAWGGLVEAWSTGVLGLWAATVDMATDEVVVAPPNAAAVPVHSDRATRLHAVFHRADDIEAGPIPASLVTCDPPVLPAMPPGGAITVIVHVSPGDQDGTEGMTDAGYVGQLLDDRGQVLTTAPVYVAVHLP